MKRTAIVTGGLRGIGLAVTQRLLSDGFAVAAMGRKSEAEAAEQLLALNRQGEIIYFSGSISEAADRAALVDEVMRRFGRIDVLVNNAGVAPRVRADLLEMTESSFDEVLGINLKGNLFLTQLCARHMVKAQQDSRGARGVIVNISSISAHVSSINRGEYCISKAGVSMLTKLFADRLAGEGICVYEIQPGIIKTDMTSAVTEKYDRLLDQGLFPIARWGTPEDIAGIVSTLAAGGLAYCTGQVIHADGGFTDVRRL